MTDAPDPDSSAAEHRIRCGVADNSDVGAVCSACGRTPRANEPVTTGGVVPWTWSLDMGSTARDADRATVLCDGCSREHARSIEAKLDAEWW